jgi:hypothetical protein
VYRSGLRRKSTTSTISDLTPSYPATSPNLVCGRSASKTFARDLPTPSTPCRPAAPPLARDIRRNTYKIKISGSRKISSSRSTEPSPELGGDASTD